MKIESGNARRSWGDCRLLGEIVNLTDRDLDVTFAFKPDEDLGVRLYINIREPQQT